MCDRIYAKVLYRDCAYMARVTVEDCLLKVPNKFELVLLASKRARDIERGATPSVPKDNDKPTIIALREIAEETISIDGLREIAKNSILEDEDSYTAPSEEIDIELEEVIIDESDLIDLSEEDDDDEVEDKAEES